MVKTALNSDMKLKMLKKRFEADSEKMGLLDSYLFVPHRNKGALHTPCVRK